jgi:hypothetical protein
MVCWKFGEGIYPQSISQIATRPTQLVTVQFIGTTWHQPQNSALNGSGDTATVVRQQRLVSLFFGPIGHCAWAASISCAEITCWGLLVRLPMGQSFYWSSAFAPLWLCKPRQLPPCPPSCGPREPSRGFRHILTRLLSFHAAKILGKTCQSVGQRGVRGSPTGFGRRTHLNTGLTTMGRMRGILTHRYDPTLEDCP